MDDLRPKNKLYQDLKLTENILEFAFRSSNKTNERKIDEDTSILNQKILEITKK